MSKVMPALEVLIKNINTQIETLNSSNFKIYDIENPEFYMKKVHYSREDDNLYFEMEEEV